ncbi:hypothetical protein ACOMHN_049325 [Nucella lapillus]
MIDTSGPTLFGQMVTMHMECSSCGGPCDAAPPSSASSCPPSPCSCLPLSADAGEVVSQDPVKLMEQTFALISQGLHRTQSS